MSILLFASTHCSSSSSSQPAGDESTSSGGFSLHVASAGRAAQVGSFVAEGGSTFVVLTVSLQNETIAALAEAPVLFTATTKSSVILQASPVTAGDSNACRADASLAAGGSATCRVVFAVPSSDTLVTLDYDDKKGNIASAAIPATRDMGPDGSAQPPARPSVPATEGTTQWFVVDRLHWGDSGLDDWKQYGYDIDMRITSVADAAAGRGVCKPRGAKGGAVDGNHGIDNAFAARTLSSFGAGLDDGGESAAKGKGTLLLRLDHVDGPDADHVPGALYLTAPSAPLRFDGTDALPVANTSVDGSIDRPLVTFPDGYMARGVWVSGERPYAPVTIRLPFRDDSIPIALSGGVVSVRVADGAQGVIAGVLPVANAKDTLAPLARAYGACPADATFQDIMSSFGRTADLVADAPMYQDADRECDAISVGLGFTMKRAAPPTRVASVTSHDACE